MKSPVTPSSSVFPNQQVAEEVALRKKDSLLLSLLPAVLIFTSSSAMAQVRRCIRAHREHTRVADTAII